MPGTTKKSARVTDLSDSAKALGAELDVERTLDEMSLDVDEIEREEIAEAKRVQPFVDFVREYLALHVGDFHVVSDYVAADGWREIDLEVNRGFLDHWLSTIYIPAGQAGRFPAALDILF